MIDIEGTHAVLWSKPQKVILIRIACILTAFSCFHWTPFLSLLLVAVSEALDILDGYFARRHNQVSAFGTIADMLIDRLTPIFCFSALIILKPQWAMIFSLLLAIDLLGHMAMIYCALLSPNIKHHKALFKNSHRHLNLYYAEKGYKRTFMAGCIFFYDTALFSLIAACLTPLYFSTLFLGCISLLGLTKVYIHLLHIFYSFKLSLSLETQ